MDKNWNPNNIEDLLIRYGAIGYEKQLLLSDQIEERDWNLDLEEGKIYFGNDISYPIQLLGTFSKQSETWLWIWGNDSMEINPEYTQMAEDLKKYGETYDFGLFYSPKLNVNNDFVHLLGLIASGKYKSAGYYAGDFGDGIALVIIDDEINCDKDLNMSVLMHFPQFTTSVGSLDLKKSLEYYLDYKGYHIDYNDGNIEATSGDKIIKASFDGEGQLVDLKGEVKE